MGNSALGLQKFTIPRGENDKEMVRKVSAWESVPPHPKQLGNKEIFLSFPGLALNTYDLVTNGRCKTPPRSQSAHLSPHEADTSATGL